jgi:hypothetical protein
LITQNWGLKMQPFDYRIAVQDPLQMALAGYQQGQQFQNQRVQAERETQLYDMEMQQYQANQAKLQQEQARAQAMQADLGQFANDLEAGTATRDKLNRLQFLYGDIMGEHVGAAYEGKTQEYKDAQASKIAKIGIAFTRSPEEGMRLLQVEKEAAQNAGDKQLLDSIEMMEGEAQISPGAPTASALFVLSTLLPPDQFEAYKAMVLPERVERKLVTTDEGVFAADLTADDVAAGMQRLGGAPERSPLVSNVIGGDLSPGFKRRDELFAEKALEWDTGGGVDALKQLTQIEDVIGRIDRGENISGGVAGFAPDVVRAFVDPNAQDAKDTVEEVVQRNLKAVLGAQFAQNEGAELIKRAFNPKLSPEINRKRLQRLFTQMRLAGEQRKAMVEYFNTNGTLQGYTGREASATDFYTAIEGQAPAAGGALPVINNQGSYDALPSGAKYTTPSGGTRTKP